MELTVQDIMANLRVNIKAEHIRFTKDHQIVIELSWYGEVFSADSLTIPNKED